MLWATPIFRIHRHPTSPRPRTLRYQPIPWHSRTLTLPAKYPTFLPPGLLPPQPLVTRRSSPETAVSASGTSRHIWVYGLATPMFSFQLVALRCKISQHASSVDNAFLQPSQCFVHWSDFVHGCYSKSTESILHFNCSIGIVINIAVYVFPLVPLSHFLDEMSCFLFSKT